MFHDGNVLQIHHAPSLAGFPVPATIIEVLDARRGVVAEVEEFDFARTGEVFTVDLSKVDPDDVEVLA